MQEFQSLNSSNKKNNAYEPINVCLTVVDCSCCNQRISTFIFGFHALVVTKCDSVELNLIQNDFTVQMIDSFDLSNSTAVPLDVHSFAPVVTKAKFI